MHSKAVSLSNKGKISIDALTQKLNVLANAIQRETNGISNYRAEVQGELRNAEEASRNLARLRSTEASLQENIYLPSPYHWQKLEQFTHRMTQLKREIEEVDSYLTSAEHQNMHSSPKGESAELIS